MSGAASLAPGLSHLVQFAYVVIFRLVRLGSHEAGHVAEGDVALKLPLGEFQIRQTRHKQIQAVYKDSWASWSEVGLVS